MCSASIYSILQWMWLCRIFATDYRQQHECSCSQLHIKIRHFRIINFRYCKDLNVKLYKYLKYLCSPQSYYIYNFPCSVKTSRRCGLGPTTGRAMRRIRGITASLYLLFTTWLRYSFKTFMSSQFYTYRWQQSSFDEPSNVQWRRQFVSVNELWASSRKFAFCTTFDWYSLSWDNDAEQIWAATDWH